MVVVRVSLAEDSLRIPTLAHLWAGAAPLEREVYDLFGVDFEDHPNLRRIVLRDDFVGHPLRKSFEMNPGGVSAEQVATAVATHGERLPSIAPDSEHGPHGEPPLYPSPFEEASRAGDVVLNSERLIINMGPQHPSMHGVLHLWLALEGEMVVGAEAIHGYLHRCIEKLCETRSYKAGTALMDRCDYVSGFHTELAFLLAAEELAELEVTPKAQYLRVLFSELCRITSHHTWLTAVGLDIGALTPFLYAFKYRERIIDVFEAVTGGRMMFNYFRPGGVKADLPPGIAEEIREICMTFDREVDEYEALLTNNELFRGRTRGVGVIPPRMIEDYCVTGPMARASGVDIDLRRDEPYAAYGDLTVNVPLGTAGDSFDRYTVRIAEMRESAKIALAALDGMPEGPYVSPEAPRLLKPPAGTAYRRVESPRGELGVLIVSDGSAQPWRVKVRSPAFSNLHVAPAVLTGRRVGDVVAIMGSVDVVMGEIDR
jgi:NADH:ubiquinone oxidoreductase subunit D